MEPFTLEVVVDSIQGWGRRGSVQDADKQGTRHEPALVLRLLDLDPVMIEADSATAMPRGFACFNGKGKALTFELPCGMLEQTLPLWLMALDLQPVDRDSDARRAVLMSSCCINLAHEVARALSQRSCAAPVLFQRLRLRTLCPALASSSPHVAGFVPTIRFSRRLLVSFVSSVG
ncbi:pks3 [Symbiodinium necroappetens]|uniref:Pks3 protein n=1 Tax=Symbiodinium necroappetens TaxID=1628268 RepID=A0A812M6V7_9DINO|nr:pks3 [Symbiodinium necroappetens]